MAARPLTVLTVAAVVYALGHVAMDPPPAAGGGPSACGQAGMAAIRATIRGIESGGNYQAQNAGSGASGAYQFIASTWGGFGGYARAADAPPSVQDSKADQMISAALGGTTDVSRVPVVWYIGHLPAPGSPEWNTIPAPQAGNTTTPAQYRDMWMARYRATSSPCT